MVWETIDAKMIEVGATRIPIKNAKTIIWVETFFTFSKSPVPLICPTIAIEATPNPKDRALSIFIIGCPKPTAAAIRYPDVWFRNNPSDNGIPYPLK